MSCNSILGSHRSEKRWDQEMKKTFVEGHINNNHTLLNCVFQVPTILRETKPQAYAPQLIGLGPYHHLRPELYAANQKQKLAAIMNLGGSQNKPDIVNKVCEEVSKLVPTIRYCYNEYLDLRPTTLAWILTVDGLFLFHYLKSVVEFAAGIRSETGFSEMRKMAGDIILLESQIPTKLLKEIGLSYLGYLVDDNDVEVHRGYVEYILNGGFVAFCQMHSPLKLSSEWKHIRETADQAHLLHNMYNLIVNNRGGSEVLCSHNYRYYSILESKTLNDISPPCKPEDVDGNVVDEVHCILLQVFQHSRLTHDRFASINDRTLAHLLHHMNRVINPPADDKDSEAAGNRSDVIIAENKCDVRFLQMSAFEGISESEDINKITAGLATFNLPGVSAAASILPLLLDAFSRFSSLFKKSGPAEEQPLVEEIRHPTITEMTEIVELKFMPTPGGIKDIKFIGEDKTFTLPVITMSTHSEIILRNLVAYEASLAESAGSTTELGDYVGLMCAIIDTSKDVEILKKADIVVAELGDNEIVAIFNGMRNTITPGAHQETLSKVAKSIAEATRQRNNVWRVKIKRNLVECGGSFWKIIRMVITLLVVVVLLAQAFCTLFSCPRFSVKNRKLQLFLDY